MTIHLHRFLFIIPILLIAQGIEDLPLRYGFIFVLSFVTSRMFPIFEKAKQEKKNE